MLSEPKYYEIKYNTDYNINETHRNESHLEWHQRHPERDCEYPEKY